MFGVAIFDQAVFRNGALSRIDPWLSFFLISDPLLSYFTGGEKC